MLLPVDLREWLPEDDLMFVILDAVAALDLGEFYRRYRANGHGRAAFDPGMMVALLLYGYCQGERFSRVIEKRCVRDVGYRVITGGLRPEPPYRDLYAWRLFGDHWPGCADPVALRSRPPRICRIARLCARILWTFLSGPTQAYVPR